MLHLPVIAAEPAITGPLADRADAYNAAANEHNLACTSLDERAAALAADPSDLDAGEVFDNGMAAERFRLAQQALRIRRDTLAGILSDRVTARREYAETLSPVAGQVHAKLVAKLHKLGFVGTGERFESNVRGSIYPGMLLNHPEVRDAHDAHVEATSNAGNLADVASNNAAIEKLIASLRNRAATAAAA